MCVCELSSWHFGPTEWLPPDRTCCCEMQVYGWWLSLRIINHPQLLLPVKGGSFAMPTAQPQTHSAKELPCFSRDLLSAGCSSKVSDQELGMTQNLNKVPSSHPLPFSSSICPLLGKQQIFSWNQSNFLCQWLIMDVSFPKNYHKNVWNPIKAVNDYKSP